MGGRKIDPDRLRAMWRDDVSMEDLEKAFACTYVGIWRAARSLGLPKRAAGRKKVQDEQPAAPPPPAATLAEAVLVEGRTWAGRLALAARFGVTPGAVLAEFHRRRAGKPPHPRLSLPRAAREAETGGGGKQTGQGVRG